MAKQAQRIRTIVRKVQDDRPRIVIVASQIATIQQNRDKLDERMEKIQAELDGLEGQRETLREEQLNLEREMDRLARADHISG
jgi:chromosome segregation ATPase